MSGEKKWSVEDLDTIKILLDAENPRIDVRQNATQDLIRKRLLETAQVDELAKKIIKFGGLFPGERIIVTKEFGKYVVLEGNRRVCACQLLLDPDLIPSGYKSSFPAADSVLRETISSSAVEIAPSREAAEVTITQKHSGSGVLEWTPAANHRRMKRLLDRGHSIDEVANSFGIRKSDFNRYLREGEILQYTVNMKCWSADELDQLNSPFIKTNPFTRFFTLSGVKDAVGIKYDNGYKLKWTKKRAVHDLWIESIARGFLLKGAAGKPIFNTRSKPDDVFSKITSTSSLLKRDYLKQASDMSLGTVPDGQAKASGGNALDAEPSDDGNTIPFPQKSSSDDASDPSLVNKDTPSKPHSVGKFFEKLECNVSDDRLNALAKEIRQIRYQNYPISATFLSRALLESSLIYCIKAKKVYGDMMKSVPSNYKKDPGLKHIIKFSIERADDIFANPERVRSLLNRWLTNHKDYCDLVVHGEWIKANNTTLEQLASETFFFVQKVLNGDI
ncbi:hypothetical protein H5P28_10550 [Ruficoccus amylovorans]|uniref:ParB/Sulfiredoxin domain-containing protein n=1 Tax=Ruficoccus amylovorans TaxID=1804625 RepID=A0A842HEP9_9BACT|nr:hypothetical protein [Ruficoccus amylovorans]MBC2594700.1 hypothetical protein [Ruficoccus amylovorans]